jgi:hypothetical protein
MAFAASDAHAALRGGWVPLSCEYAFYQAQQRAQRPPSKGALLSSMLDTLREDGQPEEGGWPYLPATPTNPASWAPPPEVGALFGRDGKKSKPTLDQITQKLNQNRPVIILLTLSRSFFSPGPHAIIDPDIDETPEPARRHAVVAVGHGTIDAQRAVLIRNSWGHKWGDTGHGWLTERFITPRLYNAATLMEETDVSTHSVAA